MNKLITSCIIGTAAVFATLSSASAGDLVWKNNPHWFPGILQAFDGGQPFESTSSAALKRACPAGLEEKVLKFSRCGDAHVKFLQCSGGRKIRKQGSTVYIGVCEHDLKKVRAMG